MQKAPLAGILKRIKKFKLLIKPPLWGRLMNNNDSWKVKLPLRDLFVSIIRISLGVGSGQPNKFRDVQMVQSLLNSNKVITSPGNELNVDGLIGPKTIERIKEFQQKVVKLSSPDGIVSPDGPTMRHLHFHSDKVAPVSNTFTSNTNMRELTEEMYVSAAKSLNCEVAAVKAVVITESKMTGPFDAKGRPTILFERHHFMAYTDKKYNSTHPDISGPRGIPYGKFSVQYDRLNEAIKLDREAALKSASWGAFQIMGSNYATSGYASVEKFVEGMNTLAGQVYAFVNHISRTPVLLNAIRTKNWSNFAYHYNGPGYKDKNYDTQMATNYDYALHH
ncbi:N-acetylmuramidase domain-containing protein [Erwinia psidii]|uniref:N-acetylmuramidase domain-containing protein n=1 Tax=Erwinia psidii TaxID=69224 RepID=UPI001F205996|nr:N-acetylmuramidase domain-containing protein [Erwinia psidii]